jgi:hypothetical protein
MRARLRRFRFYVLGFVWLFAGSNLYGVFRQVNSFRTNDFNNAPNLTRLDEVIDWSWKIADMKSFAMILTKAVTIFRPSLYRKIGVRIVEFGTFQQPFIVGEIFQLPSFGRDIRALYSLVPGLFCHPTKFRLKECEVACFTANVSHDSPVRLNYCSIKKDIRRRKFETMAMTSVYWHDINRRAVRRPRRRIDRRREMSSGCSAGIKEVHNNDWLLENFRVSEFCEFASFIPEAHVSTLRRVKRLNGIIIKPIIYSGVDAQNYERNYLDYESGNFKTIVALLFAIALISVGWWHVRFNDGSLIRGLIGGLIAILGWLPLWYALSILARHES